MMRTSGPRRQRPTFGRYQRGLSLIELIISLALGTTLVLAATDVMLSGRETYSTITATSDIQDAARFSLRSIETQVNHAGFTTDPIETLSSEFPESTSQGYAWKAGQVTAGTGAIDATQQLLTRMKGHGADSSEELQDCLGQPIDSTDEIVTQRFYITGNALHCAVSYATTTSKNGDELLVQGVQYMRLLFGVDTDSNDTIDQWLTPVDLAAASADNKQRITGVRIGLLVGSDVNDRNASNRTFTLLGSAKTITVTDSRNLLQTFESTFWLANIALMKEE